MKNKYLIVSLFSIVLAIGTMCFMNDNGDVVYATENSVSAVTPEGVDYIVEKHTDISAYRTKNEDGYFISPSIEKTATTGEWVFAGWYTSSACTDTLKKSQVKDEGYAKFVSADVLSVKCQISTDTQPTSPSTLLRCISSVDTLKYSLVGFDLETPYVDAAEKNMEGSTVGTRIQVTEDKVSNPCNYSPKVVDTESEYFYSAVEEIQQAYFDKGFLIKPYWITKDGTKVYGVSKYVIINDVLSQGAIYIPVKKSVLPTNETIFTVNGSVVECEKYDENGGYAHLKYELATSTMSSVTKYTVTGGDQAESLVYYRNLNTKYKGSSTDDRTWYTAYEGTTEDEFVIATDADLYGLSELTNTSGCTLTFAEKTIYLCADIEANRGNATEAKWDKTQVSDGTDYQWKPIGTPSTALFAGVFDGQGHTIRGLYAEVSANRLGMFAWTSSTCEIRNFRLMNSYISNTKTAAEDLATGSIVGRLDGKLSKVYSNAIVKNNSQSTGGMVGMLYTSGVKTIVEDCCFTGIIKPSNHYAGGLVGSVGKGKADIKNSCFQGKLQTTSGNAGGIVGSLNAANVELTLQDCLNRGQVISSKDTAGGLVARIQKGATLHLTRCLSRGSVQGLGNLGAAIGWLQNGTANIQSVYVSTNNCTGTTSGLLVGTVGPSGKLQGEDINPITTTDIIVSDSLTAEMIRNEKLSGLFGTNTLWTIGTDVGSNPELQMFQ